MLWKFKNAGTELGRNVKVSLFRLEGLGFRV